MSKKLYFKSIDDTFCYSLEQHLLEAQEEELSSIKLVEAIPDFDNKEHIWCTYFGDVGERSECKKSCCEKYEANKSRRGTCIHRGRLFVHGEEFEFDVPISNAT